MTKRYGNYQGSNEKKIKLVDELWDNDIDDEALNECFEVASQAYNEDNAGPSQLPTYNSFRRPNGLISSTQLNNSVCVPSKKLSFFELEQEVTKLKQANDEKQGEISILRSKIKQNSSTVHVQQQKTITEWREKLQSSDREIKAIKSQLDFKNLEIGNLKQQLFELKRINIEITNNSQYLTAAGSVKVNQERSTTDKSSTNVKLPSREAILEPVYPLKYTKLNLFNESNPEKHIIQTSLYKLSRNTIPYLQNQQNYNESYCKHKCIYLNQQNSSLNHIYPDILKLVNSTENEINGPECSKSLTKIICLTINHLNDLNDYLRQFCLFLRSEDVQQADMNYLLSKKSECVSSNDLFENDELGMIAGKLLSFLSDVIVYSKYICEYFCFDGKLQYLDKVFEDKRFIPPQNDLISSSGYFLSLLLDTIKNIGKCRKTSVMSGFLVSVCNLLINIGISEIYRSGKDINRELLYNTFKEVVFVRPGLEVLLKLTTLLKVYSQSHHFIEYLFSKTKIDPLEVCDKGILYYKEGSCTFCVLSILLQESVFKMPHLSLEICNNMVSLLYNSFKYSYWIHHDHAQMICTCLPQLYKLQIECVYKTLESFRKDFKNKKRNYNKWKTFLENQVMQKILNLINFNGFELTEKYVLVYSQFKECEQIFKEEHFDITFNTSDDLIKIPETSFNIEF
ncbi:uncharacterized protein LOC115889309 [Sitophilus oryzae]|uniref:Uncharacterized protein LOC115889309 n=1 Tax=Sitophilus oryzae TaxID=7048 RepID=A0A6J2YM74_SITOR|nr:uncharacterized protein LOC115889309 [Sitophilus oryzae]